MSLAALGALIRWLYITYQLEPLVITHYAFQQGCPLYIPDGGIGPNQKGGGFMSESRQNKFGIIQHT